MLDDESIKETSISAAFILGQNGYVHKIKFPFSYKYYVNIYSNLIYIHLKDRYDITVSFFLLIILAT